MPGKYSGVTGAAVGTAVQKAVQQYIISCLQTTAVADTAPSSQVKSYTAAGGSPQKQGAVQQYTPIL